MSDSKVFMFPDNTGNGNNGGIDSSTLLALMNNNGGFGGNNWMWIIFLFFLYPLMRNGNFFGGGDNGTGPLGNMINNDTGRQWLMEAVNGNQNAINNLANMLNTSTSNIIAAINNVNSNIQNVGNQVGLTGQQVINAVQMGNMNLAQQLASCCCENKQLVTTMGYEGQLRDQANTATLVSNMNSISDQIQARFAERGYMSAQQTCEIQTSIKDQTQAIMDKLSSMESNAQQDKIASLTAQLSAANNRAEREAELYRRLRGLGRVPGRGPAGASGGHGRLRSGDGGKPGGDRLCCLGHSLCSGCPGGEDRGAALPV